MGIRKWLFPYTASLEEQVRELKKEREDLLNRLLHAYSGYELRQPVPSYAEAQGIGKSPATPQQDEVVGGHVANVDLLAELEEATLKASEGMEDITLRAERSRVEEENREAAAEYERELMKAKAAAAAAAGHREI